MRRVEYEQDAALSLAWHTEGFARTKRLKPLRSYLQKRKPRVLQPPTPAERAAVVAAVDRWRADLAKRTPKPARTKRRAVSNGE